MRTDTVLRPLDAGLLPDLLDAAVAGAEPGEAMPPVAGPPGWTEARRAAFLRFHRSRSLAADPVEHTFAVDVAGAIAGAARLEPLPDTPGAVEAGVWLGRAYRGAGVGSAVLHALLARARAAGYGAVLVRTRRGNTAVLRMLASLGVSPTRDGDAYTAWLDPAAA